MQADGKTYRSRFVIAASGARETLAPFKNLLRFFGTSYFTCMICDGYHTTGKKLLVIDRTINGVRSSVGMKRMFTSDVTFLAHGFSPAPVYRSLLEEEGIGLVEGRPEELLGEKTLEGVRLSDGRVIPCEVILGWGGISLNDQYLEGLPLERDADEFKIVTRGASESSIPGPLRPGSSPPGSLPGDHFRGPGRRGSDRDQYEDRRALRGYECCIKNLFSEGYPSRHLFHVCMYFFGQLISSARRACRGDTVLRPDMQVLASLHPRPFKKGSAVSALARSLVTIDLCSIALRGSLRQSYPSQGKGRALMLFQKPLHGP